ncbi:MAG: hypothetical protein E6J79_13250 [Deltaproteobacteria bacterium]|nr:MAG: hypothetical protein E6J79_13250 [Deltaproteobacteria bacterium]
MNHVGSAFDDAFYSHPDKDLRQVLGLPVTDPWSRTYCGNGALAACRATLWHAMDQAAADLEAEFGDPSVANWKRVPADDEIQHSAVGVTTVPAIDWINRPTFQQVVQIPAVDHYKCYKAVGTSGFTRRPATLVDQFGTTFSIVVKPDALCNAVDKNGEGIGDPTAHLECYVITQASSKLRQPAAISNQFGTATSLVMGPRRLCVPSQRDGVPSALNLDHYLCHREARPTPRFLRRAVTLADDYESKTTLVLRPDSLCAPVNEDGGGIKDPTTHLQCYRIRQVGGQTRFAPRSATTTNLFGSGSLAVRAPRTLCVPSTKTLP